MNGSFNKHIMEALSTPIACHRWEGRTKTEEELGAWGIVPGIHIVGKGRTADWALTYGSQKGQSKLTGHWEAHSGCNDRKQVCTRVSGGGGLRWGLIPSRAMTLAKSVQELAVRK